MKIHRKQVGYLALAIMPVIALIASLQHFKDGWDDGAITAAFAKTFAETGRFAVTPVSVSVEGFSSVSWMLILSIPAHFGSHADPIVFWMKTVSAGAFFGSLCVLWRLSSRLFGDSLDRSLAVVLYAFTLAPFIEVMNGMEMNLCTFLCLVLADIVTSERRSKTRDIVSVMIIALLVSTRFEAPYWIIFVLIGALLPTRKRTFAFGLVSVVLSFLALELWRHHTFGVWMPNTAFAKLLPPYQNAHTIREVLRQRSNADLELAEALTAPLVTATTMLVLMMFTSLATTLDPAGRLVSRNTRIYGSVLLATLIALFIFGQSWRYSDRVVLLAVPWITVLEFPAGFRLSIACVAVIFVLAGVITALFEAPRAWSRMSPIARCTACVSMGAVLFGIIFGRNWGYPARMVSAALPFLVMSLVALLRAASAVVGARKLVLVLTAVLQLILWKDKISTFLLHGEGISMRKVEATGLAVDALRTREGHKTLAVLMPDIGASALCCERLEILDLGLLANPSLAREGYANLTEFMRTTNPEVIETHGIWSEVSGIYHTPIVNEYSLVIINSVRLLVRNDLLSRLADQRLIGGLASGEDCYGEREVSDEDIEFIRGKHYCLIMSLGSGHSN